MNQPLAKEPKHPGYEIDLKCTLAKLTSSIMHNYEQMFKWEVELQIYAVGKKKSAGVGLETSHLFSKIFFLAFFATDSL